MALAPEFMSDALDDCNPFALDHEIDALLWENIDYAGDPTPSFFNWAWIEQMTGCSRETYFAWMASQLLAGEPTLAVYIPQPKQASGARHLAYTEAAVKPPSRRTAADKARNESRKWGLV
jgi:hypothetical protein